MEMSGKERTYTAIFEFKYFIGTLVCVIAILTKTHIYLLKMQEMPLLLELTLDVAFLKIFLLSHHQIVPTVSLAE